MKSISKNAKEIINNINNKCNEKNIPKLLNINIFNISFDDDDKSNKYLTDFLSNKSMLDKNLEKDIDNICEEKEVVNSIDFNKNNEIKKEKNENYKNAIEEILNILKKPITKNIILYNSPFKPLLKPKIISMEGKIKIFKSNYNNNDIICNNTTNGVIM